MSPKNLDIPWICFLEKSCTQKGCRFGLGALPQFLGTLMSPLYDERIWMIMNAIVYFLLLIHLKRKHYTMNIEAKLMRRWWWSKFFLPRSVWPDVGVKNSQNVSKNAQKYPKQLLHKSEVLQNCPKIGPIFWDTVVRKFVSKNFQKFPKSGHTVLDVGSRTDRSTYDAYVMKR